MDETITVYFPEKIYNSLREISMRRRDTLTGTVSRAIKSFLTGQIPYIRGVSKNDIPVKIRLSDIDKVSRARLISFYKDSDRSFAEMIRVSVIKYVSNVLRRNLLW